MRAKDFFAYARERESVRLLKESGAPAPWTDDPVLQNWRFCNVEREDDAVTRWFAENIRDLPCDPVDKLFRCVAFRWFNRISTGKLIDDELMSMEDWDSELVRSILKDVSPVVTGAYIIKTPNGMNKLDGVIQCIEWFREGYGTIKFEEGVVQSYYPAVLANALDNHPGKWNLEHVWQWLRCFPFLGDFMAYEIVTDLANTPLLNDAPDIMTWANPGPGAARGLCRLRDLPIDTFNRANKADREEMMLLMRALLEGSKHPDYWPSDWKKWNMRTVEHTLCEFDKYERAQQGGRLKNKYGR